MLWEKMLRLLTFLAAFRIYLGRDPERAAKGSLVFFPLRPCVLCCGIAGLVALGTGGDRADPRPDSDLERAARHAAERDLGGHLAGEFPLDSYLGGEENLRLLAKSLLDLKGEGVFREVMTDPGRQRRLEAALESLRALLAREEACLAEKAGLFTTSALETVNGALTVLRDTVWGLEKDILENGGKIAALAGAGSLADVPPAALGVYGAVNLLLNCLDRLEVRGRDSAGLHVNITLPAEGVLDAALTAGEGKTREDYERRSAPGELMNASLSAAPSPGGGMTVSFTYKTFSVIGALGRNVAELRRDIGEDEVLRRLAAADRTFLTAFAHTRWASVGAITEENCHPVNNFTLDGPDGIKDYPLYGRGPWRIEVVLNGDIDNYDALRRRLEAGRELITPEVTTDTKIIPLCIEEHLLTGCDLAEAFRRAVSSFEGSHAVAMTSNLEPGRVFLALHGSGQALYIGLAPDMTLFASELYGLVEKTPLYIPMDGEKASPADAAVKGQIFVLDARLGGGVGALRGRYYDGTPIDVGEADVRVAEITTRDIDRRGFPHFFLKEIFEAPRSVRKTLQGRYRRVDGGSATFNIGEDVVPAHLKEGLASGRIRRLVVIGHGTAAVAGKAVAEGLRRYLKGSSLSVEARVASELSGFMTGEDLSDTLVIPITQSGTTTDTNRAAAMAREGGATIVSIVNRRQSDITARSHGVFYTSDGRDIEMSVASTKAFYSQVVAGHLLGLFLARLLGTMADGEIRRELDNLERIPRLMETLLERRGVIEEAARGLAKTRRYWAVVGSGPNKTAADEIRIKLSELCYRTISSDVIENKKHIDLSAEPLIIVCAAGTPEKVLGDVVKDVAIFKAHRAGVIVFADEDEERFHHVADAVIPLPAAPEPAGVILNTMAGHLWGYYAARSIDEDALFLREFRDHLNRGANGPGRVASFYERLADRDFRKMIRAFTQELNAKRREGCFSCAGVNTVAEMVLLLKYAAGKIPLEDFWADFHASEATSPLDRLDACLGQAIDELTRPIDAIRHQAKTVTVGTSRKVHLPAGPIFDLIGRLGFPPQGLTSRNVSTIGRIQPAVAAVRGYTLYEIEDLDGDGNPTDSSRIRIADRGGIARDMASRVERRPLLVGTKRTIVSTRHVYVGRGRYDNASIVVVPILGETSVVRHLLLVHVLFQEDLSVGERIAVLGYKLNDIRNMINEYNLTWDDAYLADLSVSDLLSEPAEIIVERIKGIINGKG